MSLARVSRLTRGSRTSLQFRCFHTSTPRNKVSQFLMPAMSPTMTEGGIAQWKLKEGDKFSQGDVLLEIETDKATIDVEAQEDGILGKIIAPDGTKGVQVGKLIALLAEEGDDLSNLEIPKEENTTSPPKEEAKASSAQPPSPQKAPSPPSAPGNQGHTPKLDTSTRIFPSVIRLLHEYGLDPASIKGTGRHGMLTKGDVLAFLGQASSPTGTSKAVNESPIPKKAVAAETKPLTGPELRRLIVEGLSDVSRREKAPSPPSATFETIVASYLRRSPPVSSTLASPTPPTVAKGARDYLEGLI